jgi:hypothetical protein
MSWDWNPDNDPYHLECMLAWDAITSCASPVYQFNSYYRYGKLDDCSAKISDLATCVKLKFSGHDAAKEKLEELFPGKGNPNKPHPVFNLRPIDQVPPMWQSK